MHHFFRSIPISDKPNFFGHIIFSLLFMFGILALLQAAPKQFRKYIIAFFTFLGGLYYVAEFFWPATGGKNFLTPYNDIASNITNVIFSYAIGLGVISLLQLHIRKVVRTGPGWINSAALIISFLAMFIFGLLNKYSPEHQLLRPMGIHATNANIYDVLFVGGVSNFGSAIFAMIAFFIASAAYRSFRIRSIESSLLMTAALIIMLGSVGFGTVLTNWLPSGTNPQTEFWANFRIENVAQWLQLQINTPAQRGIILGVAVGELAMALRLWLSLERGSYFDKEI